MFGRRLCSDSRTGVIIPGAAVPVGILLDPVCVWGGGEVGEELTAGEPKDQRYRLCL